MHGNSIMGRQDWVVERVEELEHQSVTVLILPLFSCLCAIILVLMNCNFFPLVEKSFSYNVVR